ncbi:levanase [Spiroplasma chinense]|uniref:Levanase n=1 Tax=Spiroplasma chinense TaxID=216932 RepID=A0A5B9Y6C0_9MOLU|nr:glycoside hydrolase family 32 protein [Spiroplasma chinense]QEH62276.1 levanase [Spiroplasma chinense]
MKKLLNGLAAFSLVVSVSSTTVSCKNKASNKLDEKTFTNMFHVQNPDFGMMNDIQGGFFLNGKYHVYFLQNPDGIFNSDGENSGKEGSIWYHVTTTDFINWNYEGMSVPKSIEHYRDSSSGSLYVDTNNYFGYGENTVIAIVASFSDFGQTVMMYYSTDGGYDFSPVKEEPIITNPNIDIYDNFRDPYFFVREVDGKPQFVAYIAENNFIEVFTSSDPTKGFTPIKEKIYLKYPMLECPSLYEMNVKDKDGNNNGEKKWVLFYGGSGSNENDLNDPKLSSGTYYAVGTLNDEGLFVEDEAFTSKRLDFGPDYYAANFWKDKYVNTENDWLYTAAWANNWGYNWSVPNDGRLGLMSLARKITLVKNDTNDYEFNSEFVDFWNKEHKNETGRGTNASKLKTNNYVGVDEKVDGTVSKTESFLKDNKFKGETFKLDLDLKNTKENETVTFKIADNKYNVEAKIDLKESTVSVDRKIEHDFAMGAKEFNKLRTYPTKLDKEVKLEIYVDRNIIEFKFPDEKAFTMLKFPIGSKGEEVTITSSDGSNLDFSYYQLNWKKR